MPDVYISTKAKDMKCKIRDVDTGAKKKEAKKPEVDPLANITCYSCQTENPFDAKYRLRSLKWKLSCWNSTVTHKLKERSIFFKWREVVIRPQDKNAYGPCV